MIRTLSLSIPAIALALSLGCGNPGTTGGKAAGILPGTWSCASGGSITFNDDGTGTTDCTYFLSQVCSNDGTVVTSYGITWEVINDPDVVNDNLGWSPDEATRAELESELGCTLGEGNVEEPLLLAKDSEVKFGFDFFGEESVFETLTR